MTLYVTLMFGYAASNALTVSWRALVSASDDCQPERVAVPEIDAGSNAAALGALLAALLAALLGGAALAPPETAGALLDPEPVQAPTIGTTDAANARNWRMCCLLDPAETAGRVPAQT